MRLLAILFGAWAIGGMAQVSPYNGLSLIPPDSAGNYRLLIGGHFHGASTNRSGFPAATVLAGLDAINATKANALLSTGDLFLDPDRDSARYAGSFFSKLVIPIFNAPGNHDVEGRAYNDPQRYPQLLRMGRDRIILFDTERDDSSLKGAQLELLRSLADSADRLGPNLFIVTHRPIWAEENERYSALFAGNTRSMFGTNYGKELEPLLQRIAAHCTIYWISGSMAGRAPFSVFFQKEEHVTYIQSAVRDELRDAILLAEVSPTGVRWSGISLTGAEIPEVTGLDADRWEAQRPATEGFNWRLLPYLVRKNLSYPAFWYGAASMALLLLSGLLVRRWKRGASDR